MQEGTPSVIDILTRRVKNDEMCLLFSLIYLFTVIGFSPGGSSPYTSTHNTNGHINFAVSLDFIAL
jgi:hypothetical protein